MDTRQSSRSLASSEICVPGVRFSEDRPELVHDDKRAARKLAAAKTVKVRKPFAMPALDEVEALIRLSFR
jgi:hypothetical protein